MPLLNPGLNFHAKAPPLYSDHCLLYSSPHQMTRNLKAPAIVLKMNPVGENHRGLAMLAAGEGLIRPFAYGAQGRRSSLRASAVPFNRGVADLHYDGARDRWRLTAFDPEHTHDGLREDLDRFYTAASWAEILLRTHGGGDDSEALFQLASPALDRLSSASGLGVKQLGAGFLWLFLGIEGVRPDPMHCGRCGRFLGGPSVSEPRFWPNGLLVGGECAESRGTPLPAGSLEWLQAISESGSPGNKEPGLLEPGKGDCTASTAAATEKAIEKAMRIPASEESLAAVEQWLLTLVQALLEKPLKSRRPSLI